MVARGDDRGWTSRAAAFFPKDGWLELVTWMAIFSLVLSSRGGADDDRDESVSGPL